MGSGNSDLQDREPYDEVPVRARRRWPWAAALVALAVAAVAGGVAVAGNIGAGSQAPVAGSTATATASSASAEPTSASSPTKAMPATVPPSPSATATPAPSAGSWQSFTTPDGRISFDHPGTWQVSSPQGSSPGAESGSVDLDVSDEAGIVVASLHSGPSGGIGGACQSPVSYVVLDSVDVDIPYQPTKGSVTPRFTFRALQEADHVTASYGLTSFPAGQNGMTCMFYNAVNGPADSPLFSFADTFQVNAGGTDQIPNRKGAKTFASLDAARGYMQTPEYLNAKRMITSLKVKAG